MTTFTACNRPYGATLIPIGRACLLVLLAANVVSRSSLAEGVVGSISWQVPLSGEVRDQLAPWLRDQQLDVTQRRAIDAVWTVNDQSEMDPTASLFDRVTFTIGIADPEARRWIEACQAGNIPELLIYSAALAADETRPAYVRNHLKLLFAKTLVWLQLTDEAASHLDSLDVADVADPSSLLFYRGVVEYRLRQKEAGLSTLAQLLENEPILPARFIHVARLMQADLKSLEKDSLDEAARLMDSIRARLQHGRAGTRVRDEEQKVIEILDKLIEQLESQQQQMQSQGMASGQQSAAPAADSSLPNASGQGDVDRKDQGKDTAWGNLPPAEREAALQRLAEDYPAHYREAAEEYFRVLAREE